MSKLEDEARKLVDLRNELERIKQEYEDQRLRVHNELVNSGKDSITVKGYKISRVKDSVILILKESKLKENLKKEGLSDSQIFDILFASKEEVERVGIIVMNKIS